MRIRAGGKVKTLFTIHKIHEAHDDTEIIMMKNKARGGNLIITIDIGPLGHGSDKRFFKI